MKTKTIGLALALIALAAPIPSVSAATHEVVVGPGGSPVFSPADIMISVGDTVHWVWDTGGHNVGSGLPGSPTPAFLSGPPAPAGTTFDLVFDQAFLDANPVVGDVYDYHCHPHGTIGMVGSVTVDTSVAVDATSWSGIKALYR